MYATYKEHKWKLLAATQNVSSFLAVLLICQ